MIVTTQKPGQKKCEFKVEELSFEIFDQCEGMGIVMFFEKFLNFNNKISPARKKKNNKQK
jgi:hypothetical protein